MNTNTDSLSALLAPLLPDTGVLPSAERSAKGFFEQVLAGIQLEGADTFAPPFAENGLLPTALPIAAQALPATGRELPGGGSTLPLHHALAPAHRVAMHPGDILSRAMPSDPEIIPARHTNGSNAVAMQALGAAPPPTDRPLSPAQRGLALEAVLQRLNERGIPGEAGATVEAQARAVKPMPMVAELPPQIARQQLIGVGHSTLYSVPDDIAQARTDTLLNDDGLPPGLGRSLPANASDTARAVREWMVLEGKPGGETPRHVIGGGQPVIASLTATPASGDAAPVREPVLHLPQNALTDTAWGDSFGSRITWLVKTGVQEASIQLVPEHLGQIRVKVSLAEQGATVHFQTRSAETGDLIETMMPRLASALEAQGIRLDEARVTQQPSPSGGSGNAAADARQQGADSGPQPRENGRGQSLPAPQQSAQLPPDAAALAVRTSLSQVDFYA